MKQKNNILLVNMSRDLWGGNETYVAALANNLSKRGYKIVVACSDESLLPNNLTDNNIEIVQFRLRNSGDIVAISKLVSIINKRLINIIHGNWGKELWPVILAGKMTCAKSVFTRHMMQPFKNISQWVINNWLDRLIVPSKAVFDSMFANGIHKEKMRLVYNGIDIEMFYPELDLKVFLAEHKIDSKGPFVGIISIIPYPYGKGHFKLIESIPEVSKIFSECRWLIIGDGPMKLQLIEYVRKLKVEEKVIFINRIAKEKVPYAMNSLDIFVLPSYQQEACPFVVLEAMACGIPVIAGDIGGNKELVDHGVTGYLFPSQDAPKLAEFTIKLLSDTKLRKQMGIAARKKIEERFSYNIMVQETERVYQELVL